MCHVGCVCLPQPPTRLIRHCFLEQTAAWVEIYVNILKGTLAQKFICAGSDAKLTPLIIFNLFANQDPKRTRKRSWILTWVSSYSWTGLGFCFKIFILCVCAITRHTEASTFLPWVDVILWSTLLILQKGADVPDPAWLPWGPPTLLEQMCSAIVNRHVCLSPSYYSRRMINRLITQKHQCKATEQ